MSEQKAVAAVVSGEVKTSPELFRVNEVFAGVGERGDGKAGFESVGVISSKADLSPNLSLSQNNQEIEQILSQVKVGDQKLIDLKTAQINTLPNEIQKQLEKLGLSGVLFYFGGDTQASAVAGIAFLQYLNKQASFPADQQPTSKDNLLKGALEFTHQAVSGYNKTFSKNATCSASVVLIGQDGQQVATKIGRAELISVNQDGQVNFIRDNGERVDITRQATNTTAQVIAANMRGVGPGVKLAGDAKVQEYVERITNGEDVDTIMQGLDSTMKKDVRRGLGSRIGLEFSTDNIQVINSKTEGKIFVGGDGIGTKIADSGDKVKGKVDDLGKYLIGQEAQEKETSFQRVDVDYSACAFLRDRAPQSVKDYSHLLKEVGFSLRDDKFDIISGKIKQGNEDSVNRALVDVWNGCFDPQGEPLANLPIAYLEEDGRRRVIFFDKDQNNFFVLRSKENTDGFLRPDVQPLTIDEAEKLGLFNQLVENDKSKTNLARLVDKVTEASLKAKLQEQLNGIKKERIFTPGISTAAASVAKEAQAPTAQVSTAEVPLAAPVAVPATLEEAAGLEPQEQVVVEKHKPRFWADRRGERIPINDYIQEVTPREITEEQLKASGIDIANKPDYITGITRLPNGHYQVSVNIFEGQRAWIEEVTDKIKASLPQKRKESAEAYRKRVLETIHGRIQWQADYADDPLRAQIFSVDNPLQRLFRPFDLNGEALKTIEAMLKLDEYRAIVAQREQTLAGLRKRYKTEPTTHVREKVVTRGMVVDLEGEYVPLYEKEGFNQEAYDDMMAARLMFDYLSDLNPSRTELNGKLKKKGVAAIPKEAGKNYRQIREYLRQQIHAAPARSAQRRQALRAYNEYRRYFYQQIYDAIATRGTLTAEDPNLADIKTKLAAFDLDKAIAQYRWDDYVPGKGRDKKSFNHLRGLPEDIFFVALKGVEMHLRLIKEPVELGSLEGLDYVYGKEFIQSEAAAEAYLKTKPPKIEPVKPPPKPKPPKPEPVPIAPEPTPQPPVEAPGTVLVAPLPETKPPVTVTPEPDGSKDQDRPLPAPTQQGEVTPSRQPKPGPPRPPIEPPQPLETTIRAGIAVDPTRNEQNIGALAQHYRAREKPARKFWRSLILPITNPREFFRNMWQNTFFDRLFNDRAIRFCRDMTGIARRQVGFDTSIPLQLSQDILSKAVEGGRDLRKRANIFRKFGYLGRDFVSGMTGLGQNTEMALAKKWLEQNGKPLIEEARKISVREQGQLGSRYALEGDNANVISTDVGETRYLLSDLIKDEALLKAFQAKIKELIAGSIDGGWSDERVLKEFNQFYHERLFPQFDNDKREELKSVEVSSSILQIIDSMKLDRDKPRGDDGRPNQAVDKSRTIYQRYQDEGKWEELSFDFYVGRARYESARGEIKLTTLQQKLIRRMAERDYQKDNPFGLKMASGGWEFLKDAALYGGSFVAGGLGGAKFLGRSIGMGFLHLNPLTGMAAVSVMAGAREGMVVAHKGKLWGLAGKTLRDFEQISREAAQGRMTPDNAVLRRWIEQGMVDQVVASDLTREISNLLTKESLTSDEQKSLLLLVAQVKARMKLTDLSSLRGRNILGMGEINVLQNFIGYHKDNRNEEQTALRAAVLQGLTKLSTTDPQLITQLDKAQAVMESQLRVGSNQEKVVLTLAREMQIDQAQARQMVGDFYKNLNIAENRSLEGAARTLAKLTWKRFGKTMALTAITAPLIGAEMKVLTAGIAEGVDFVKDVAHGGLAEYGHDWQQVFGGDVPVEWRAGHIASRLTPLQNSCLWGRSVLVEPPVGPPHTDNIDGVDLNLSPLLRHKDLGGGNDYLVDIRNGRVYDLSHHQLSAVDTNGDNINDQILITDTTTHTSVLINDPASPLHDLGLKVNLATKDILTPAAGLKPENIPGTAIQTQIPNGTHWEHDVATGGWDLKIDAGKPGAGTILVDDAKFDASGHMIAGHAEPGVNYVENPGVAAISLKGAPAEKVWQAIENKPTGQDWWTNKTRGSDFQELQLYNQVRQNPDGSYVVILDGSRMHNASLDHVNFQDVQTMVKNPTIASNGMQWGFHLKGHDGFLRIDDASDGNLDQHLALDPTSNLPVLSSGNPVLMPDGHQLTMGEFSKMVLNQNEIQNHVTAAGIKVGANVVSLSSEYRANSDSSWLNIFNLGNDKGNGVITVGFTGPGDVYNHLAAIRGAGPVQIETAGGVIPQVTADITGQAPEFYLQAPAADFWLELVPLPMRQNIERSIRKTSDQTGKRPPPTTSQPPAPSLTPKQRRGLEQDIKREQQAIKQAEKERDRLKSKGDKLNDKEKSRLAKLEQEIADDRRKLAEAEQRLRGETKEPTPTKSEFEGKSEDELRGLLEERKRQLGILAEEGKGVPLSEEKILLATKLKKDIAELEARLKLPKKEESLQEKSQALVAALDRYIQNASDEDLIKYLGLKAEEIKQAKTDPKGRQKLIDAKMSQLETDLTNKYMNSLTDEQREKIDREREADLSMSDVALLGKFDILFAEAEQKIEEETQRRKAAGKTEPPTKQEQEEIIMKLFQDLKITDDDFKKYKETIVRLKDTFVVLYSRPDFIELLKEQTDHFIKQIEAWEAEARSVTAIPATGEKKENAAEVKKQILEKAGKRSYEEIKQLQTEVQAILDREKQEGSGKLKGTIQEIEASQKQQGKTETIHEEGIVYLPKTKGNVSVVGDIHGDSLTVEQILNKTRFIENMEEGDASQILVFMGDYVDRGPQEKRVMEMLLELKKRYPRNVILMKADHETVEGYVTPQSFPQTIKEGYDTPAHGQEIFDGYLKLFNSLARLVICGNGVVITHGGIPAEAVGNLLDLKANERAFKTMAWADPVPISILPSGIRGNGARLFRGSDEDALRQGLIIYSEQAAKEFLAKIGGQVIVRGHQISEEVDGGKPNPFPTNILWTVHSTGKGSTESYYGNKDREQNPSYAEFDMNRDVTQIDPSRNIIPVWKQIN